MKLARANPILDRLVTPLVECLTPDSARRVVALKADAKLQSRVNDLDERHARRLLTHDELAEYSNYVSYGTFIAILKSKARQLLAASSGE
jgi:hypothetical protein